MFVASIKASLVLLYFMGLKWDKGFNRVIVVSAIFCFAIFIVLTLADTMTRKALNPESDTPHSLNTPVKLIKNKSISNYK